VEEHRFRFFLLSPESIVLDIAFNSQYGLKVNGELYPIKLKELSTLYIILEGETLWLAINGIDFSDIILERELGKWVGPLQVVFDTGYSDSVDISNLKAVQGLPLQLKEQLHYYSIAPSNYRIYYSQKYVNGTLCEVGKQPREITIYYFCDYFGQSEF